MGEALASCKHEDQSSDAQQPVHTLGRCGGLPGQASWPDQLR